MRDLNICIWMVGGCGQCLYIVPFALSGAWRLSRLSLQSGCASAGSLQGIIVQSGPPAFGFLGLSLCL